MRRSTDLAHWFDGPIKTVVFTENEDPEIFSFESTWIDKEDFWLWGDLVEFSVVEPRQTSEQE